MSGNAITLNDPQISPFSDGQYTGAESVQNGRTPPGWIKGFPNSYKFWQVPSITPAVGERHPTVYSLNKRLVYVNGIMTPMQAHANTVKLVSVISGAVAIGIYNQSGSGTAAESTLGMIRNGVMDVVQCIGDKLGTNNNPASKTLAKSVYDACVNGVHLNIVAHSQGALITSRGTRQGIGMLLDHYGRINSEVRPLIANVERRHNFFQNLLRGAVHADDIDRMKLDRALRRLILPGVEQRLRDYVSVQTFGGAANFYPNGPLYRHVNNGWDPVSNAVGQGSFVHGGGRDSQQVQIERNSNKRIRDFDDHSMDGVYLQPSQYYTDRNGNRVDTNYVPIDMGMVR